MTRAAITGRHDLSSLPAVAFDEPPKAKLRDMATIAVDDPGAEKRLVRDKWTKELVYTTPRARARINVAGDVLAQELRHRRISEEAFATGRLIEAVLQWGVITGGGQWMQGDRVDAAEAHEWAIAKGVDRARAAQAMKQEMRAVIGQTDARVIERVLVDGATWRQIAATYGKPTKREQLHWAWSFRKALQDLADLWKRA